MFHKPTQANLKAEAIIHGIIIVPMLLLYFLGLGSKGMDAFILPALLQLVLGVFQVVTAIIRVFRHGSALRWLYLRLIAGYLLALIFGAIIYEPVNVPDSWFYFVLFAVPSFCATVYWIFTIRQAMGIYQDGIQSIFGKKYFLKTSIEELKSIEDDDKIIQEINLRHQERLIQKNINK